MKKKVTNKELAELVGKSEQTIKGWKTRFPELLELLRVGAFCKVNNLDTQKIIKLSELQEVIKTKE